MDQILFEIRRAGVSYAKTAARAMKRWMFTHSRVDIFVIHEQLTAQFGAAYQSDIRARLGITRCTMSVMMRRLERRGYIERTRSKRDIRKLVVAITDLGRRAFAEIRATLGNELFTPFVNAPFFVLRHPTPVEQSRESLHRDLAMVRSQFRDITAGPYPP